MCLSYPHTHFAGIRIFPTLPGYAIKSGEEQRGETLKSLLAILAILGVVALFFDRYDFLSLVAILAVFCSLKFIGLASGPMKLAGIKSLADKLRTIPQQSLFRKSPAFFRSSGRESPNFKIEGCGQPRVR